jgi:hypothetical protein
MNMPPLAGGLLWSIDGRRPSGNFPAGLILGCGDESIRCGG